MKTPFMTYKAKTPFFVTVTVTVVICPFETIVTLYFSPMNIHIIPIESQLNGFEI